MSDSRARRAYQPLSPVAREFRPRPQTRGDFMADMLRDIDERRQAQGGRDAAGELEAEKKWWTNTINLMFDLEDNLDPVNYKIFEFCFGEMLSGACPPEAISECREQAVLLLDAYPILLERLKTQIFDNERIMARIYENARETEARVADGQPCGQNASRLQPIPEEHN